MIFSGSESMAPPPTIFTTITMISGMDPMVEAPKKRISVIARYLQKLFCLSKARSKCFMIVCFYWCVLQLFLFIHPLKDIAGLTVQLPANDLKRAEADGFGFSCFQYGEVGRGDTHSFRKLVKRHLLLRHLHIQVYDDWHTGFSFQLNS